MGRLHVTAFCPGCHEIRPVGDFGWEDIAGGTLHARCRICRSAGPRTDARCACGQDDAFVLIPADADGRPTSVPDRVDHHVCLACLSARVGGSV